MATEIYPSETTDPFTQPSLPISTIDNAVIYLSIVKIVIGIIGITGNLMVLAVLKFQSQRGQFLICSQAVIDMLTSILFVADAFTSLYPPSVPQDPIFGYLYCLIWNFGAIVFVFFALSTYNLVAISIERYVLVLYPLYYRTHITRRMQVLLGGVAWLLGPIFQVIYCITQLKYSDGSCVFEIIPLTILLGVFMFVWEYFIPVAIMGFCFTRICVRLYGQDKEAKHLKCHSSPEVSTISSRLASDLEKKYAVDNENKQENYETSNEYRRSRNITKTFVIIFVVYIICWSTNQFLFLQKNLGGYDHWGTPENHFANSLAMLNSACNPFIYVLHMKHYRMKLVSCWQHCTLQG